MSLGQSVKSQLLQLGNPVPPGKYVSPGGAMPAYQGLSDVPWDGAARGVANAPAPAPITKHIGLPSNHYVTSSLVINPMTTREEKYFREGQVLCVARKAPVADMYTATTTHQLTIKCAIAYAMARRDLRERNLPEGLNITEQQFDELNEEDIREYIDQPDKIPDGVENDLMRQACRLLKIKHFKYLLPVGVVSYWRIWGGINNMGHATSMETRISQANAQCVVANSVICKRVFLSNQYGSPDNVVEHGKIGFTVTRAIGEDGKPAQTIIVPWAQKGAEVPAYCDRVYKDALGRHQPGYFWFVGTVHEITAKGAPSTKCAIAAGLRGTDYEAAHDAMGSLPVIMVQWGI